MTVLDTVKQLLALGYSVIPSGGGPTKKAPIVDWTKCQAERATPEDIEGWQSEQKPTLYGIVTGAISGVVVFDADAPEIMAVFHEAGLKPHVKTRRGEHYYFRHPGHPLNNKVGILPHLDLRGDGGFVNCLGENENAKYEMLIVPTPDTLYDLTQLPEVVKRALMADAERVNKPAATIPEVVNEGGRNATLASLAGSMRHRGVPQSAIEISLLDTNKQICKPPLPESEVLAIAQSIMRYPEHKAQAPGGNGHSKEFEPVIPVTTLRCLTSIQAQAVAWLWTPYIPFGKLTLLEGDPGTGKSWLSLAIATAISLGEGLPGQTELAHGPVLLISAEDGLADTIKPRLAAMGANTDVIHAIDGLFTLDDIGFQLLENYIQQVVPVLIIVDPLVAYLSGDVDIHKANQVRQATARLARLAESYGPAVIAIRHLTKGGSLKPIYRGLGSIDFTAAARSVLLAGCDPDNPQIRGFVQLKCNLAPLGDAVGYELRDGGFFWTDHSDLTAGQILGGDEGGSVFDDAKGFLNEKLADGPAPSNDLIAEAEASGISERTLKRAKGQLGVAHFRQGKKGEKGGGQWYWKLPDGDIKSD